MRTIALRLEGRNVGIGLQDSYTKCEVGSDLKVVSEVYGTSQSNHYINKTTIFS